MKDISLHILDIVHNSIRAHASKIGIFIAEDDKRDMYTVSIEDNGKGINPEKLSQIADPYTTSRKTRKVGMGLPLLKHSATQAGGDLFISSQPGMGTKVKAEFCLSHIDRPPLGDIAGVFIQLAGGFPGIHFIYTHQTSGGMFSADSFEIQKVLEGISLDDIEIRKYIREMITENLDEIGISG